MKGTIRFEVRPIEGAAAAVGERVTFEGGVDGGLVALNEDGEPFGKVPGRHAEELAAAMEQGYAAEVESREGDVLVVKVAPAQAMEGDEPAGDADEPAGDAAVKEKKSSKRRKLPVGCIVVIVIAAIIVLALAIFCLVAIITTIPNLTQTISDGVFSFEVPTSWTGEEFDDEEDEYLYEYGATLESEDGSVIMIIMADMYSEDVTKYLLPMYIDDGLVGEDPVYSNTTDEGALMYRYDYENEDEKGYLEIVLSGDYGALFILKTPTDNFDNEAEEFREILDSMTFVNPVESVASLDDGVHVMTIGHVTYEVPMTWMLLDRSDGGFFSEYYHVFYSDDYIGRLLVYADASSSSYTKDEIVSLAGIDGDLIDEYQTDDGAYVYLYEYYEEYYGYSDQGYVQIVVTDEYSTLAFAFCLTEEFDDHADELEEILYSVTVVDDDEDGEDEEEAADEEEAEAA